MDILPLPLNPTSKAEEVPYVCTERYDGGSFLSYPTRHGRPEMVTPSYPPGTDFSMREKANPTPIKELEAFYQTWLYFGLLCEFAEVNSDSLGAPPLELPLNDYLDFIYNNWTITTDDDRKLVVGVATLSPELELWKWTTDTDTQKLRCNHLFQCLRLTHWMLNWAPPTFDHRIKFSIAALAEYFNFMLGTKVTSSGWTDVVTFYGPFASKYVTPEVEQQMRDHGWCPSSIESARNRFNGLQTIHMLSKMDKSVPFKDHSRCTAESCGLCQIKSETYKLSHCLDECDCSLVEVDSNAITEMLLETPDSIPLLNIIPGNGLEDLRIELVQCSPDTLYVAISHVWADGLGNPSANSLHRCQMARLKRLIDELHKSTSESASTEDPSTKPTPSLKPASLLWIDALCCPDINGPGKQKAIEKLRLVYRKSHKVLVLDASLFSLRTKDMHIGEIALRAYTSPWMGRLWTLQEASLPKEIYFQFADRAIYSQVITNELKDIAWNKDARYLHVFFDTDKEHEYLRSFFHVERGSHPSQQLETLEMALQSRSLSVPSDEPVCISTLSGLEIEKVLSVTEHHHRMREIWMMIAEKFTGIPSCIIFYEDQCLAFPGWRWAPRSFLYMKGSQFSLGDRKRRWTSRQALQLGTPTPEGLRVRFPGFLITANLPDHKSMWEGMFRPTETVVYFQDDSGTWYQMSPNNYHDPLAPDYLDWAHRYRKEFGWRMSDVIRRGNCAIICERVAGDNQGQRVTFRGILAEVKKRPEDGGEKEIAVDRIMHVLVSAL